MDVQDENIGTASRNPTLLIEVTLEDWPDVTPVFVFLKVEI